MGSLPNISDGLYPATEVPLFNTTTNTGKTFSYHHSIQNAVPISNDIDNIVTRFAQFVSAVVGRNNVAYLVETDHRLSIVNASVTPAGVKVTILQEPDDGSALSDLGFCISTVQNRVFDLQKPFILAFRASGDVADLQAYLCRSHGPAAAAQHLLQLAISYMSPEASFNDTERSLITVPSVSATHRSPVLHDLLEQAAARYGNTIAIDEITGKQGGAYMRKQLTYGELENKASKFAHQLDALLQQLDWPVFLGEQYLVPILMPNSTELNICMNAISKSGHAFCALPLDAPEQRIRDLLEDLGAPGILGVGDNLWKGTAFGEQIIWIDYNNIQARLEECQPRADDGILPRRLIDPEDLAYIIYTSGSSGKPKGVMMQHSAAVSFLHNMDDGPAPLPAGSDFRWMVMSAPTFDIMLMDNFMAFKKGGTVCLAERSLLLTQPEAIMHELRATATFTVTSLAMLLRSEKIPTVSWLSVGGELLGQRVVDNFAPEPEDAGEASGSRRLICGYGPTEATVFITNNVCDKTSRPSVVGQPLPNMTLVVLDTASPEQARAVPAGIAGELAVAGPQLSSGYLNRPEETAQAFIETSEFGRLYRTGDRVRVVWTEDGQPRIDYLGRLNTDQIKLNGRRVDLPEIENVLSQCKGVARAATLVSDSKLVACIMPWQGSKDVAGVEHRCRVEVSKQLPAYMRPVQYFVVDELPLSANGKVDRRALSSMLLTDARAISAEADTGPTTEDSKSFMFAMPALVRSALTHVLGSEVRSQPETASLLQLGLDSLCAVEFLQNLNEAGIEPPHLYDILGASTISDLIAVVEQSQLQPLSMEQVVDMTSDAQSTVLDAQTHQGPTSADGIDVSIIAAYDEEKVFELSIDAKMRHFEYHLRPKCLAALGLKDEQVEQVLPTTSVQTRFVGNAVDPHLYKPAELVGRPQIQHFPYNIPIMTIDPARLQRAVEAVLPRHDCFRTVFTPVEHPLAPFAQCILSPSIARVPKIEVVCDDTDAESRDSLWVQTVNGIQRAAENYMSIDKPGIAMAWVWSPSRARCTMIMTLFHGIFDGTQLNYLWDIVLAEYENPGSAPATDLLPMRRAVEFALDYDWIETGMYWVRRLAGVPPFHLGPRQPVPRVLVPNPVAGFSESHMRACGIKASMTLRQLKKAAQAMSVSMLCVGELAWASVLAQTLPDDTRAAALAGKRSFDIQWSTVLNGRRHKDAMRCMAPMMAAVPQILFFDGSRPVSNREACAELSNRHHEAQPHVQMPCPSMAHYKMGCGRFDSVLLLQALAPEGARSSMRSLPGFNLDENVMAPFKEIDVGFPLTMEIWPGKLKWDEKMLLRCMYSNAKYKFLTHDWMHAALSAFDEALVRITSAPDEMFYIG
ncbi:hypothetical protein LMH87_009496 [Akanthomyces muscarius]|uniref:Carrier domain-containing protein n=1 Tax=Akanthomyces muscarius TaxID=2231603 RepID=A0A9W8UMA8_AKAMU|nr:hypothetical protein LMH87_009496 [Akanthomyces muscarius]KAJ4152981.1 hypothetical protein LMH87_009496 [Akanthomyces muscarius]